MTITCISPIDGSAYATRETLSAQEAKTAVARAKDAQRDWAARPLAERIKLVQAGVAAVGAMVTAVVVWLIAQWAPGGATPLTLTLAGAAITAFLGALISVAHLLNQETFEQLRVWLAGSLSGRRVDVLSVAAPWLCLALGVAMVLSRKVTVLAMGDDVARGLGVRAGWLKVQVLLCVVVLTACSVALAGPLGFVGLVIPHVVRLFIGSDYRWIVPYSALVGGAYLLGIDIIARLALRPQEIATGIMTAMVGAPLFIHLVRQRAS